MLPWAFVGLRWPPVAVVGCYGPLLSRKEKKIIEKNTPRAQTTPDASFGPFFVFVGLRWPSLAAVGRPGLRSNNKKMIYGMTTRCKNKIK